MRAGNRATFDTTHHPAVTCCLHGTHRWCALALGAIPSRTFGCLHVRGAARAVCGPAASGAVHEGTRPRACCVLTACLIVLRTMPGGAWAAADWAHAGARTIIFARRRCGAFGRSFKRTAVMRGLQEIVLLLRCARARGRVGGGRWSHLLGGGAGPREPGDAAQAGGDQSDVREEAVGDGARGAEITLSNVVVCVCGAGHTYTHLVFCLSWTRGRCGAAPTHDRCRCYCCCCCCRSTFLHTPLHTHTHTHTHEAAYSGFEDRKNFLSSRFSFMPTRSACRSYAAAWCRMSMRSWRVYFCQNAAAPPP